MAGRPRLEVSDEHIRQIGELAGYGLTQEQIADVFGWSERTLRNRLTEDPNLSAAYQKGKAEALRNVAKGLYQRAVEGDNTASIFYLKTQGQWREVSRTEVTGKDGGPIQQEVNTVESPRESIERELARLAERQAAKNGARQVHR